MIPLALAARLPWRYIGIALAAAALIAGAVWAWNDRRADGIREGRAQLQAEWDAAERTRLAAELTRRNEAEQRHATERAERERVRNSIASKVSDYAQTASGAAVCLDLGRVQQLRDFRASLDLAPASGGDAALPTPPAP